MDGIAIVMMVLFMVVIWGGLILSIIHLLRHDDDTSGNLGDNPEFANDRLYAVERQN